LAYFAQQILFLLNGTNAVYCCYSNKDSKMIFILEENFVTGVKSATSRQGKVECLNV
jgi:hypothetical protein